ncbi:NAD(P)-binding protein [Glonium stellatum]|uniref:NAD(P)-binding protein n=1 Tax=Glonium stellatum TaxID=574774 RepID=A0A8E2F6N7_9PEZI|nr:NAD(P)-binding protein [Glonium stellatum]
MPSPEHETQSKTHIPGVAVVMGAAGAGIGDAVALAFAESGCTKIAVTDRNDALLCQTASAITAKFPHIELYCAVGDTHSEPFVNGCIKGVLRSFGRVDYYANCTSILSNNQNLTETSIEEVELVAMLKQEPLPSHNPKTSAKRRYVTPLMIISKERIKSLKPAIDIAPMKHICKPSEIADSALFLYSIKATFNQGYAFVVDGGPARNVIVIQNSADVLQLYH